MSETLRKAPVIVDETPGVKYYCRCGQSLSFPYCDGSHEGTEFKPSRVEIETKKKVAVCGCGQSKTFPFCDGTHKTLP